MRIKTVIFVILVFVIFPVTGQTAKEKRDSSINDSRAKHLVERFEKSVIQPKSDVQEKIRKSKARRRAILWHIENSGLKESQKNKLRKALEKQTKSNLLLEFIAKHEEQINEYVKLIIDS